jgi:Fe2+ or Zn2+ uptake regulation protein
MRDSITILRQCGIQPTPQRIAVVDFVFETKAHPSADMILDSVRRACPTISRATVYNTLNLLVEKGLLRTQILKEGTIIFDPNISRHHHFVDEESGKVYDIPWEALKVTGKKSLKEFEIKDYQVVMRGRKKSK